MQPTDFLSGIFNSYPFLAIIGPLVGLLMASIKATGKLQGFALLGAALLVTTLVTVAYGYSEGWTVASWHKAPFAIVVILAVSQLTATTTGHAKDSIAKAVAKQEGDG